MAPRITITINSVYYKIWVSRLVPLKRRVRLYKGDITERTGVEIHPERTASRKLCYVERLTNVSSAITMPR